VLAKDPAQKEHLHQVCTTSLNLFRLLTIYLKPVLPKLAAEVEKFLNVAPFTWNDSATLLTGHVINPYQHLAARIDPKQVAALLEETKESLQPQLVKTASANQLPLSPRERAGVRATQRKTALILSFSLGDKGPKTCSGAHYLSRVGAIRS
jgi:hypothetical protein